jgi:hypothetical protein
MRGHDVVLPLAFLKREQRHALRGHEGLDRGHERHADGGHQDRGRKRVTSVRAEEGRHAAVVLQLGHVDVEIQPVDALHLQRRVLLENFAHGAW